MYIVFVVSLNKKYFVFYVGGSSFVNFACFFSQSKVPVVFNLSIQLMICLKHYDHHNDIFNFFLHK
jgi:hypothetical protein